MWPVRAEGGDFVKYHDVQTPVEAVKDSHAVKLAEFILGKDVPEIHNANTIIEVSWPPTYRTLTSYVVLAREFAYLPGRSVLLRPGCVISIVREAAEEKARLGLDTTYEFVMTFDWAVRSVSDTATSVRFHSWRMHSTQC